MTKVTFENATIRDVIGKASRVAPTKGSAFDKSAGVVIEVDAGSSEVIVRSTNTEIFYMEITDAVEIEGATRTWRIPSVVLDGICSKLPITSGKQVTFDDQDSSVLQLASGRMRAKIRLMDPTYFPTWEPFDPTELTAVADFGARIQQVQWAASKTANPPLTGVNLSGTHIGATAGHVAAITPCEITQIVEPVTIPASIFTPLMKSLGEVRIGQEYGQLLVMPDEATQIRAVIFDGKYPNLLSIFKREETNAVMVKKTAFTDMIDQAMVMGRTDRGAILKVYIGLEEVAVMMEDQEIGLIGNVLEVPSQATHERHLICFSPEILTQALSGAPNEDVTIYYTDGQPLKPVRVDGGSGYEVLIMPRKQEVSV